ncbi:MAG: hypothetical protein LW636_09445 [Planctomycetaceae bacterium]|nr:hypothetical protein [Planctomycetaceae bacterium]
MLGAHRVSFEQVWALSTWKRGRGAIEVRPNSVVIRAPRMRDLDGSIFPRSDVAVRWSGGSRATLALQVGETGTVLPCWFASDAEAETLLKWSGQSEPLPFERRESEWMKSQGGNAVAARFVKPIVAILAMLTLASFFGLMDSLEVSVLSLSEGEYWKLLPANLLLTVPGIGEPRAASFWIVAFFINAAVIAGLAGIAVSALGLLRSVLIAASGAAAATTVSVWMLAADAEYSGIDGVEAALAGALVSLLARSPDAPPRLKAQFGRFLKGALLALAALKAWESLGIYLRFGPGWLPQILPEAIALTVAFGVGVLCMVLERVWRRPATVAPVAAAALLCIMSATIAWRVHAYNRDIQEFQAAGADASTEGLSRQFGRRPDVLVEEFDLLAGRGSRGDALRALSQLRSEVMEESLFKLEAGIFFLAFVEPLEPEEYSSIEAALEANPSCAELIELAHSSARAQPQVLVPMIRDWAGRNGGMKNAFVMGFLGVRVEDLRFTELQSVGAGLSGAHAKAFWELADGPLAPYKGLPFSADVAALRGACELAHTDLHAGAMRLQELAQDATLPLASVFARALLGQDASASSPQPR